MADRNPVAYQVKIVYDDHTLAKPLVALGHVCVACGQILAVGDLVEDTEMVGVQHMFCDKLFFQPVKERNGN